MTIKVFLADDHQMLIDGFALAIQDLGFEIAGSTTDGRKVKDLFIASGADVLVCDIRFNQEIDGLEVAKDILAERKDAKIIILTQFNDSFVVEKAFQIGALGFLSKDEPMEILSEAISVVYKGERYLSSAVARGVVWGSLLADNPSKALSERELVLFVSLANGATPQEAQDLAGISYKTFITSTNAIKSKLGLRTYSDFTKVAIKFGLISLV